MKITRSLWLVPAALTLLGLRAAQADTIKMKLLSSGAIPKMGGGYMQQRLILTDKVPDGLKKAPEGLVAPLYGTLTMGTKEKPTSFIVIVDEPDGKDARLFIDTNANGDLTDDPAPEWKVFPGMYPPDSGLKGHIGGANVQLQTGGETVSLHLGMYRFDKKDTARAALKNTLLYYADYAYEGEVTLGGKTYKAMLTDDYATGDFRGKTGEQRSGVRFLIDVNQNGKFDRRGESYDISKPFNIAGTTYEITDMSPAGSTFQIVKSAQSVPEILPPPDLSPGKKILPFEAKTTGGKTVQFPSSFKGKIVMLDFWATWCGPCIGELPNLTKAYSQYHSRGFEVLGISLDQKGAETKLATFTTEHKMPWQQVYDGKYWDAEIAQLFVIQSIPAAFLVDGDTGEILAAGDSLRGELLAGTVKSALQKKKL